MQAAGSAEAERVEVDFLDGEAYDIRVRGHRVLVDQPADPRVQRLRAAANSE